MEEKIIYKELKEIKPYENNPRINEGAVEGVKKSIEQFGFRSPIILDKENVIIAGHTRYLASKELKLEKVPCIVAEDLTEEQVKALRLVDNKVAEGSSWDFNLLDFELDAIKDINMEDFGFINSGDTLDGVDDFFKSEEYEKDKEKEKKKIICPHCGKEIEI